MVGLELEVEVGLDVYNMFNVAIICMKRMSKKE